MNWPVTPYMINVLAKHRDVTEKHLYDLKLVIYEKRNFYRKISDKAGRNR